MIDILMATYNGEKFIETQLTSIINQTYKEWRLYIQDDLSTDKTIEILKKYETIDDRINIINNNEKLGCGKNFLSLLKYSTSEFVCFADQDDYWFENKLQVMYDRIEVLDNLKPQLVVANCLVWTYPKNTITPNYNFVKPHKLNQVLFTGGIQGCLTLFNKVLMNYLRKDYSYIWLHDHYLLLNAIVYGEITYIDIPMMLYRQHEANVTPHFNTSIIRKVLNKFNSTNYLINKRLYRENEEFYKSNKVFLDNKTRNIFDKYFNLEKMNRLKCIINLLFSNYTIADSNHFYFVLKVIMKNKFIGD